MADVRISNLAAAVAANLDGNSLIPTTDSEGTITTCKVTLGQMRTALLTRANGNYAATDYLSLGGAAPPSTGWIRVDGTTVTASTPILNAIQTWNQGATVFTGLLVQITNTASSASSLLMDYQVGGFSKWKVDVAGYASAAGNANVQALTATTGLFTAALTYGGVTLSNAVTGTGNMVLSASPTFTGTITAAIANFSANTAFSGGVTFPSGGSFGAGSNVFISATTGLNLVGRAGSSTDYTLINNTVAGQSVMDVPTGTQNVRFYGALSGITTLAGTGAVSGFTTANFSNTVTAPNFTGTGTVILSGSTQTTGAQYIQIVNTGVNAVFGVENSTGGNIFTGTSAYAIVIGSATASRAINLVTNNTVQVAIASTGAVTFAGALSGITTLVMSDYLTLGKAYAAGVVTATGTIAIKDNTGTIYNVLVHT